MFREGFGVAVIVGAGAGVALVHGFLIVEPDEFLRFLGGSGGEKVVVLGVRNTGVVHREKMYIYASVYGGFTLLTKTSRPLLLPSNTKTIKAEEIILPPAVWTKLGKIKKRETAD